MFLKKVMVVCLSALMLVGCGSSNNATTGNGGVTGGNAPSGEVQGKPVDTSKFKKFGDIYACDPKFRERGNTSTMFYAMFEINGIAYRAEADLPKDVYDQLMALELDENFDKNQQKITADLEITKFENLTEMVPPQEELDKWIGKTGKDLQDDGYVEGSGYNLDDMTFYLYKEPFYYAVTFEKDKEYTNSDDFDVWKTIGPLTIKSIKYDGI